MALVCTFHPGSTAEDRCAFCRLAICPMCVRARGKRTVCRACGEGLARERRRLLVRALLAAALLIASALVAALALGCG